MDSASGDPTAMAKIPSIPSPQLSGSFAPLGDVIERVDAKAPRHFTINAGNTERHQPTWPTSSPAPRAA